MLYARVCIYRRSGNRPYLDDRCRTRRRGFARKRIDNPILALFFYDARLWTILYAAISTLFAGRTNSLKSQFNYFVVRLNNVRDDISTFRSICLLSQLYEACYISVVGNKRVYAIDFPDEIDICCDYTNRASELLMQIDVLHSQRITYVFKPWID